MQIAANDPHLECTVHGGLDLPLLAAGSSPRVIPKAVSGTRGAAEYLTFTRHLLPVQDSIMRLRDISQSALTMKYSICIAAITCSVALAQPDAVPSAAEESSAGGDSASTDASRSGTAISEGGQQQPFAPLPEESLPDTAPAPAAADLEKDPDVRRIEAALANDRSLRDIAPAVTVLPGAASILIGGVIKNDAQRARILMVARAHTDRPVEDLLRLEPE